MKKVNKSDPPNELTNFSDDNPVATWDDFRSVKDGVAYKAMKATILEDQGGLCAYCEQVIYTRPESRQRIEHFHSKSDTSQPDVNWALDWSNVIAVCLGGSSSIDDDHARHPLPGNLSCDSYKAYFEQRGRIPKDIDGYVLNPLDMPAFPNLFSFDKATGNIEADSTACNQAKFFGSNVHQSLEDLVNKTIEALNLNCQRLCDERLEVLKHYNQQVAKARKDNNVFFREQLASRWFNKRWPSFFTTRRALLGIHAEKYLEEVEYNG